MAAVKQVGSENRKLTQDMAEQIDKEVEKSKNLAPVRKSRGSSKIVRDGTARS